MSTFFCFGRPCFNCFPLLSVENVVHSNTRFSTTFKPFTVIRKFYPFKDSLYVKLNYVGRLVRAFRGIGFPLPADVSRTPCGGGVPEDRTHTAPSRTGSDPVRTTGHGRHRLGSSQWRSSRGPPRMGLLPAARCSWASFRWGFSRGRLFSGRLIAAISSAPGLIHGALLWRGHFGPSRSIPPFPPTSNCGATGVWTRSDTLNPFHKLNFKYSH